MQVRKRRLGLGAQAGPLISTAGLGSDRLGSSTNKNKIIMAKSGTLTGAFANFFEHTSEGTKEYIRKE